jgi:pimeloyl-ACP methyl ester carboxylesterase
VIPELGARGHEAVAVDLPGDDRSKGLPEYADLIEGAISNDREAVVVAQSLGGFASVMACARTPVHRLVLVNAMIPLPHETPGEWFSATRADAARQHAAEACGYSAEFDVDTYFLHDVPASVRAAGESRARDEADIVFAQPCDFERWPGVPTRVLATEDDRFFPPDFQRRVARERLHVEVDVMRGGHLVALARPSELAERLVRYGSDLP